VRTEPHRASLNMDYSQIQEWALQKKRAEAMDKWIDKKLTNSYVHVNDDYKSCTFTHKWFQ
jgi:peptidyl-prolyl cis-trans isomerase SurA